MTAYLCRFDMGANQVCLPAEQLHRRIKTGYPVMALLMVEKFQREQAELQASNFFLDQIRRLLISWGNGYPDVDMLSKQMCMS